MKFWDPSALVPLIIEERRSQEMAALLQADQEITVWWAASIECVSAIARQEREGAVTAPGIDDAFELLRGLRSNWTEIPPSRRLRDLALRLLRSHALRAADALQLAAALTAAEETPATLEFVCLDDRLALAASREGFTVIA